MTFTGSATDHDRLRACPFAVTTREEWRYAAEALVLEMGGTPVWLEDQHRIKYHAALAHASNHLNTLLAESIALLNEIGIDEPNVFLEPLVQAAIENALGLGVAGLTGPISRGDVETVRHHMDALVGTSMFETYQQLALATVESALSGHRITSRQAEDLRQVISR
jgi:predicted short-subunit dehydrogenase-like oxidoreductase (DUF2520 family)